VFGSPTALARAKSNVEKYFAVVGVLEWLDKSLGVMEKYVPRYFKVNIAKTERIRYNNFFLFTLPRKHRCVGPGWGFTII
jgi:hypothetical protein